MSLTQRLGYGLVTRPSSLPACGLLLGLYALLSLSFGQLAGTLSLSTCAGRVGRRFLRALVVPALLEELVFRAALLPHPAVPAEGSDLVFSTARSLVSYVLWHVLQGYFSTGFLFLTGLLGLFASLLYFVSGGCLWIPVLLHAGAAAVWKDCARTWQDVACSANA